MIIMSAGKCNLQSTSRYKYPPSCLMISRLGCLCHKVLLLNFNNITTFKWSTSLLVFLTYSFFCVLPIHIAVWRPSLHLHPTACRRIWPLIGQMLRAVNHCGKACGVILLVSFFFFFTPASGWLGALHVPHCSEAHPLRICRECVPCAKWGPHGSRGPTHSACSACREGRGKRGKQEKEISIKL